jgi:hypothetical protein
MHAETTDVKNAYKFYCKKCDFKCSKKSNYNQHLLTRKHNDIKKNAFEPTDLPKYFECKCGKIYKHKQSLFSHKIKCEGKKHEENEIIQLDKDDSDIKNMFLKVLEDNKELRNIMCQQQQQITEMIPKIGNTTNNNTFNLQVFLDEKCKDALNISDFIESLNIQIKDLEHTKTHGICEGVANIFVNGLKELGTYKRPIHCTDMKRETLYIKENDEWGKEKDTKSILKKNLYDLADKQRKSIKEWQDCHPNWENSEQEKEEWIALVKNVMGSLEENKFSENKIIRNIAKEVKI